MSRVYNASRKASNLKWNAAHPEQIKAIGRKKQSIYRRTLRGRFLHITRKAVERYISFELSFEDFSTLVKGSLCHYCEAVLPEVGGGLDRKNSNLGYSVENCVPCCTVCNRIRNADYISYAEMFEVVKLLKWLRGPKERDLVFNYQQLDTERRSE